MAASLKSSLTPAAALEHRMRAESRYSPMSASLFSASPRQAALPSPVFELDASRGEIAHNGPQFLPDGNHFLYMSNARESGVVFASLDGKTRRFLFARSNSPAYYAPDPEGRTGWLLYPPSGTNSFARPFDPAKGEVTGDPVPIADSVPGRTDLLCLQQRRLDVPALPPLANATDLVQPGTGNNWASSGRLAHLAVRSISPDQQTVAFSRTSDGNSDVWLLNLARNSPTRFTLEPGADTNPVWSPDGQRLFYTSRRQNEYSPRGTARQRARRRTNCDQGQVSERTQSRRAASKDGHWLVLTEAGARTDPASRSSRWPTASLFP